MEISSMSSRSIVLLQVSQIEKKQMNVVARQLSDLKIFIQTPELSSDELTNGFLQRVKQIPLSEKDLYSELFSFCKKGSCNFNWHFLLNHISDDFFTTDDNFKFLLTKLLEFKDFNNAVLISRLDRIENSSVKDNLNLGLLKTNSDDFWAFWFQKFTNVTLFHNYDLLPAAVKSEQLKCIVDLNKSFIDDLLKYNIESKTDPDTICCFFF